MSTGMPAGIWLTKFGAIVTDYFGETCYQVGSSISSKDWRDVDVRLLLPNADFKARFGRIQSAEVNPKLAAVTLAFSALGKAMTGLPIDFQIQPLSHANERYGDKPRSALYELRPLPGVPTPDQTATEWAVIAYDVEKEADRVDTCEDEADARSLLAYQQRSMRLRDARIVTRNATPWLPFQTETEEQL